MATVYSKQLFAKQGFTSTTTPNGYIPGSGITPVIRSVTCYTASLLAGPLVLVDLYSGAEIVRLNPPSVNVGYYELLECRIVCPAGFEVQVDAGDTVDVTVSGYELYA